MSMIHNGIHRLSAFLSSGAGMASPRTTSIEPEPEVIMSRQVKRALIRRAIKDDLSRRKRVAMKAGENAAAITV